MRPREVRTGGTIVLTVSWRAQRRAQHRPPPDAKLRRPDTTAIDFIGDIIASLRCSALHRWGRGGARCALVLAWRRSRLPPHGRAVAFPFRPLPERRDIPGATRSKTLVPGKGEDCPHNYRRRASATNARGRRSGSAAKLCMVVFNARPGPFAWRRVIGIAA